MEGGLRFELGNRICVYLASTHRRTSMRGL